MTPEQKTVYIFAAAVRALIKSQGMTALNMQRQSLGKAMAYDDLAFFNLIDEEGIHDNNIISFFNDHY